MGVKKEETTENECKRKFRMGENVYLSNREIMLPVRMTTENDDYIRRIITVSIVDREDELFLCGLKTLIEWKAAVFYERSEMMFDETKKRVYMSISGGGHQLVKLETLGEISHEEKVFHIEKKGVGANKKEIEKLHRHPQTPLDTIQTPTDTDRYLQTLSRHREKNSDTIQTSTDTIRHHPETYRLYQTPSRHPHTLADTIQTPTDTIETPRQLQTPLDTIQAPTDTFRHLPDTQRYLQTPSRHPQKL